MQPSRLDQNVPTPQQFSEPNWQGQQYHDPNWQGQQYQEPNWQGQQFQEPNWQGQQYQDPNLQGQQFPEPNLQKYGDSNWQHNLLLDQQQQQPQPLQHIAPPQMDTLHFHMLQRGLDGPNGAAELLKGMTAEQFVRLKSTDRDGVDPLAFNESPDGKVVRATRLPDVFTLAAAALDGYVELLKLVNRQCLRYIYPNIGEYLYSLAMLV